LRLFNYTFQKALMKKHQKKEFYLKHHALHIKEIFRALRLILAEGEYADKAIEKIMRFNKNWNVKERTFVAETTYDIIRHWRLLSAMAGVEQKINDKNLWPLFGAYLVLYDFRLPESNYFKGVNAQKYADKLERFVKIRKIRESVPDWLDLLGEKELGRKWEKVLGALNEKPTVVLRANTLKTSPKELQEILAAEGIAETTLMPWSPEAVELTFSRNVFRTDAFQQGLFEVQDAASQMASEFLNVQPGMRVIDACAGTGGKTLHLAALMKNKGKIVALDTKDWKLQQLKLRAKRAGVQIVETKIIDSTKVIKRLHNTADRLLLDVPCSGLGVLRRNPDSKWKLQPEEIERVRATQKELLERFSLMTKTGGLMAYTTCSILPSEGEEQVKDFISLNQDKWKLIGEKRYSPEVHRCDGFYIALMEKIN